MMCCISPEHPASQLSTSPRALQSYYFCRDWREGSWNYLLSQEQAQHVGSTLHQHLPTNDGRHGHQRHLQIRLWVLRRTWQCIETLWSGVVNIEQKWHLDIGENISLQVLTIILKTQDVLRSLILFCLSHAKLVKSDKVKK